MILGMIIEAVVGLLLAAMGFLIWKKQKVSLLHDYHYKNVKEEDLPAYTKEMGLGLIVMGLGIILTGVLDLIESSFWWAAMAVGFVIGLIMIIHAQKKYNGSMIS